VKHHTTHVLLFLVCILYLLCVPPIILAAPVLGTVRLNDSRILFAAPSTKIHSAAGNFVAVTCNPDGTATPTINQSDPLAPCFCR
jgi:hypothetical protein